MERCRPAMRRRHHHPQQRCHVWLRASTSLLIDYALAARSMESHQATEFSLVTTITSPTMQTLHLATWNLTLSGPGRPDHSLASDSCPASISFLSLSCVSTFSYPSLDDTHFAFRFWERYLWVPINSTLRINIDIDGIIVFGSIKEIPSRLQTYQMTTYDFLHRYRLGLPLPSKSQRYPQITCSAYFP